MGLLLQFSREYAQHHQPQTSLEKQYLCIFLSLIQIFQFARICNNYIPWWHCAHVTTVCSQLLLENICELFKLPGAL